VITYLKHLKSINIMDNRIKELSPIVEVIGRRATDSSGEPLVDKNGNHFVTLRLQGLTVTEKVIAGKKYTVKGRGKQISMNQWEESYLPSLDTDPFFNSQVGDMLDIEIFRADVKPYNITDGETGEIREVESYTFPVIAGDNPKTILENADRELAEEDVSTAVSQEEAAAVEQDFNIAE
jgi:hypothetical protein